MKIFQVMAVKTLIVISGNRFPAAHLPESLQRSGCIFHEDAERDGDARRCIALKYSLERIQKGHL